MKQNQAKQLETYYLKLCKSNGIDNQVFDFDQEIDFAVLTYSEAKNILNEKLSPLIEAQNKTTKKYEQIETERIQQQAFIEEAKRSKEEFEQSIKQIIQNNETNTNGYFHTAIEYIKMVAKGYTNGLILKSSGGLGKTYITLTELEKVKEENQEINIIYMNTYSTPLEFYQFLYKNNNKNTIIILDDFEGILTNPIGVSILKSAMWSISDKRKLNYLTTSDKRTAPEEFNFDSRMIFLVNSLETNPELEAMITRCLYVELNFSYEQTVKIMYEIAKQPYKELSQEERIKIMDFIKERSNEATELNFRTLIKAFDIFRYCKDNKQEWTELIKELLQEDDDLKLIMEIMNLEKEDRNNKWIRETGKSIRTLQRKIREINKKRNDKKTQRQM